MMILWTLLMLAYLAQFLCLTDPQVANLFRLREVAMLLSLASLIVCSVLLQMPWLRLIP